MKKFLSVILFFITPFTAMSQLLVDENFSYVPGTLTQVSGGVWIEDPAGLNPVQVIEGNLSYAGYASSGIGNYIFLDGGAAGRAGIRRNLSMNITSVLYVSFLLQMQDTLDLNAYPELGAAPLYFMNSYGQGKVSIWVKKSFNQGFVRLGISKLTAVVYDTADIAIDEPVLVVLKYKFSPGSNNDTLSLFLDPPLAESEPQPDIYIYSGTDLVNIAALSLRQTLLSGNIILDGIRASTSWGNAPLPVELVSFTAKIKKDVIELTWKTETEKNNYGFEIERMISSGYKNQEWKKIGFTGGSGNSSSPKFYLFKDNEVFNYCRYSYRLRQIDNDGNFSYSPNADVEISIPGKFDLFQNYPNPFNPLTNFTFSIPENGNVIMDLYNIAGEKVCKLLDEFRKAGDYELQFDGGGLPGGVYFCNLIAGNLKKTIKIIIVK